MPEPSNRPTVAVRSRRSGRVRRGATGALIAAFGLTMVISVSQPGDADPRNTELTDFAPVGDGGPADEAGLDLGANWTIFGAAPGQKATAPTAAGFDTVVDGRTVKQINVSFSANPDVATEDSVTLTSTSRDGGRTFLTTQPTDWASLSYLRLSDGSIKEVDFIPEWADSGHTAIVLDVHSSDDLGETWTGTKAPVTPPEGKKFALERGLRITRGLMELPDGTLLQPAYTQYAGDVGWRSILLQSTDDGGSWTVRSTIATSASADYPVNEATISFTRDSDRMVAVIRQGTGAGSALVHPLLQTFSDDLGKTWSDPTELLGPDGEPVDGIQPTMVLQPNGMLLMSTGRPANRVYVSADGSGEHWELADTVFDNAPKTTNTEQGNAGQERYFGSGGNTSMIGAGANRTLFFYDTCITNNWCHSYNEQYSIGARYVSAVTPGVGKIDVLSKLLDHTATLSGSFADTPATFPEQRPEGAFDGSSTPRAATVLHDAKGGKPSMTLQLDRTYSLNKIGLMLGDGQPLDATVQLSTDGKAWGAPVIKARQRTDHAMSYSSFADTRARYVRVTGAESVTTPITEMELYAADIDTFENDAELAIPRGWSKSKNVNVQSIAPGGYHSQRALRIEDRYTDQAASISKITSDTDHQVTDFRLAYEFGGDPLYFAIQGRSQTGADPVDRWHFRIIDPQTSKPQLQTYSAGRWQTFGTLPGLEITNVANPVGKWHQVHVDATATKAEVTIDGRVFTTSMAAEPATLLSGLRFHSDGMELYHTEMWIDDVEIS
ncbi:sialidase family protein [Microlunatus soli]|uniref:BNR repeat-like domain-containing protein n=1 Tax=Microlunatus soli TaxID=630515 RepID=A0A1H1R262_9ACTN|nr:sialidase family protein [Microlunatus soli]SDS29720.1 BNR repeat-like domain-containing protein [Microlunatus soli]